MSLLLFYYHYYLLLLCYFYVYFIFSFVFALLCMISCVVAFLHLKFIACCWWFWILKTIWCYIIVFFQSILYFWKLKNQILFKKKKERFFKRQNQHDCRFNCLLKVTQNFNSMFTIQTKNHSLQNKHFSFFRFLKFFGLDTFLNYPGLQVYQTYQTVWNLSCLSVFRYFCRSPSL